MDSLKLKLEKLPKDIALEVRKAVNVGAFMVQKEAIKMIKRRTQGRVYARGKGKGKRRKFHVASTPFGPPNTDTGNLWKNIKVTRSTGAVSGGVTAFVVSKAEYSKALEFGTSKMKRRPFMNPALNRSKKKIKALIQEAINGVSRFKK